MEKTRVFVSHAGKDRERFVNSLIERLKNDGIDVWFSEDEIRIGDSLVEKIEHGLSETTSMIIILSNNTKDNNWVDYERYVGVYKRVSKRQKIYPVILDNVTLPASIQDIRYCKIDDLHDYNKQYQELLIAIRTDNMHSNDIDIGVSLDRLVLKWFGVQTKASTEYLSFEQLKIEFDSYSEDDLDSSIRYLNEQQYVTYIPVMRGDKYVGLRLTLYGFETYLLQEEKDSHHIISSIGKAIIADMHSVSEIAQHTNLKFHVVKLVVQRFAEQNLINIIHTPEDVYITKISESMRRKFRLL